MAETLRMQSGERIVLEATTPAGRDATSAIYVHGLGSHRGGEKALFLERELTARGLGFVRFDLRGHGESDGRLQDLTLTRQLEDLAAVVDHVGSGAAGPRPRRLLLIGASLGALTVAWHTALARPQPRSNPVLLGQVLIAPAFRIIERYLAALGDFGRARWQREGTYRFVGPWFEFDLGWNVVTDADRHPHSRLLRETTLPTLLLHGTKDETAPLELSVEFAAECVGVRPRLVAVEGGDHRLTAFKERLLAEIVRFVAENSEGELACAS